MVISILIIAPIFIIGASLYLYPIVKLWQPLKNLLHKFDSSGQYVSWMVNQRLYPFRKMIVPLGEQVLCIAKIIAYVVFVGALVTLPLAIAMFSGLAILSSYFDQFMPGEDYGTVKIILGAIWCLFFVSVLVFDIIKVIKFKLGP